MAHIVNLLSIFKGVSHSTQPAFNCPKLKLETLEQGVKCVKVNNRHQNDAIGVEIGLKFFFEVLKSHLKIFWT